LRLVRISFAVLFLVAGVAAAQTPAPAPYEFEGEFVVAVAGSGTPQPPAPEAGGPESAEPPIQFEKLFTTTRSAPAGGPEGLEEAPEVVTWYKVSVAGGGPELAGEPGAAQEHPWDLAHDAIDGKSSNARLNTLAADVRRQGMRVTEIEPHVAFRYRERKDTAAPCASPTQQGVVSLCGDYTVYWPPKDRRLGWHALPEHSQLAAARDFAARFFPPPGDPKLVTVAHFDTGYDKAKDASRPERLDLDASFSFYPKDSGDCGIANWNNPQLPACDRFDHGFGLTPGHGPSTLSILAGNRVNFPGGGGFPAYNDYLGGAPLARVVAYRVSPTVILLWPANVATAIHAAAGNVDVISMSMGGLPSGALRDAVNEAYEKGTAMFFATGDFVRVPIPILNIHSPRGVIYPARFSRTTPVAGITAAGRSYGDGPSFLSLLFHRFQGKIGWMLRGSYGPESKMREAISAYTPNVTKHYANADGIRDVIAPNFEGTSAATPQVAAAATLWLQVHRGDQGLEAAWRTWQKTEAVYNALLVTAKPVGPVKFFGRGALKANDALGKKARLDLPQRPPARIGHDWMTLLARILGDSTEAASADADTAALHTQMLRTEILQLVASSPRLQEIVLLHEIDFDSPQPPSNAAINQLRRGLLREKRASQYLKRALRASASERRSPTESP